MEGQARHLLALRLAGRTVRPIGPGPLEVFVFSLDVSSGVPAVVDVPGEVLDVIGEGRHCD